MSNDARAIIDAVVPMSGRTLYETDEHLGMARQVDALRSGRLHEIDRDSLADYLMEMTIRDRRELESRLRQLVHHLLKIRLQPERMSKSWGSTARDQQAGIAGILKSIPSLRAHAPALFADAYPAAVRNAAADTGLPQENFPA